VRSSVLKHAEMTTSTAGRNDHHSSVRAGFAAKQANASQDGVTSETRGKKRDAAGVRNGFVWEMRVHKGTQPKARVQGERLR